MKDDNDNNNYNNNNNSNNDIQWASRGKNLHTYNIYIENKYGSRLHN